MRHALSFQNMRNCILTIVSLCCMLLPTELQAQDGEYLSDTVSIESSRLGLTSDQMGRFITIIDRQQIQSLPVRSLDELLRFLPGVEVQARGAFGVQADISMRGGTFNQVLILMDGMRINDPLTGHFQTYLPVTLDEIERIEVLRGPASAQYGPDAVGGLIHIITRSFSTEASAQQRAMMSLQTGQHALYGGEAGMWSRRKKLRVGAGCRWFQSEGHPLPSGERADFRTQTVTVSAGYAFEKGWDLAFRSGWDQRTFQAQYFYTVSPADQSREQTGRWWNQARLQRQRSNSNTRLDVSYLSSSDSFLFNPAFPANIHQTSFLNANLHHQQEITSRLSWALGGQASLRSILSSDRGDHRDDHQGLYGMLYWEPIQRLHLQGSLRTDRDQNYGIEMTPQSSASYTLSWATFRAAVGRTIRAADYTERFISTNLAGPLTGGRNLGNPALEAERAWSYEMGIDVSTYRGFRFSATLFHRQGRNLIDYLPTSYENIPANGNLTPGESYLFANNLSRLNVSGAEGFLQWKKDCGPGGSLVLDAGYTFLAVDAPAGQVSKYLSNTARHQLTARGMWLHQRFSLGIQGLYRQRDAGNAAAIGATLSPQFMVWHLQGRVNLIGERVVAQAQVFNIFNESYADLLGAQMPGRWWTAGLSFRFLEGLAD